MFTTFPSFDQMDELVRMTPEDMHKNPNPHVAVYENYLTEEQCDAIFQAAGSLAAHKYPGCRAVTTDYTRPFLQGHVLRKAIDEVLFVNSLFWKFDVDFHDTHAWLQTYERGSSYADHMDVSPGQSRKLSAVIQLSKADAYRGGNLVFNALPHTFVAPRGQGSIIVFEPWIVHHVAIVTQGLRQSVNLGFYGPPFK